MPEDDEFGMKKPDKTQTVMTVMLEIGNTELSDYAIIAVEEKLNVEYNFSNIYNGNEACIMGKC